MYKKLEEKEKAIQLRQKGYSLNEISDILRVSKSSISMWVRNTTLSLAAERRIALARQKGIQKRLLLALKRRNDRENEAESFAKLHIAKFSETKENILLLCALMYWCEGGSSVKEGVAFTNADPNVVSLFTNMLRKLFSLDEKKFRVTLHLHAYHNEKRQLLFWSKITNIPTSQFTKPYRKQHTGIQQKDGYPGCVRVRYHDVSIARILLATARLYLQKGL